MDHGDLDAPQWWNTNVAGLPGRVVAVDRTTQPRAVGATSQVEQVVLRCAGGDASEVCAIVKRSPDQASAQEIGYPQWRTERNFYRQAAHQLPLRTPSCRYAWASSDGLAGLLVLDDVGQDRQPHDPLSRALATAAVDALIPTQVTTWGTTAHHWAQRGGLLFAEAMPGIWSRLRDQVRMDARSLYDSVIPRLPAAASMTTDMDLCFVHGDCSPRNLLWSGHQVTFIDFGTARVSLGAIDISRIVASTPELAGSVAEHRNMCAYWREQLYAGGIVEFDADQAWLSYRLGLALNAQFGALMEIPPWSTGPLAESYRLGASLMVESLQACGIPSFLQACVA